MSILTNIERNISKVVPEVSSEMVRYMRVIQSPTVKGTNNKKAAVKILKKSFKTDVYPEFLKLYNMGLLSDNGLKSITVLPMYLQEKFYDITTTRIATLEDSEIEQLVKIIIAAPDENSEALDYLDRLSEKKEQIGVDSLIKFKAAVEETFANFDGDNREMVIKQAIEYLVTVFSIHFVQSPDTPASNALKKISALVKEI